MNLRVNPTEKAINTKSKSSVNRCIANESKRLIKAKASRFNSLFIDKNDLI